MTPEQQERRREVNREAMRRWREANPEKIREYEARRSAASVERSRKASREYEARRSAASIERRRETTRQWIAANLERNRERSRAWKAANPARAISAARAWQEAHPAEAKAIQRTVNAKRRASQRGATIGDPKAIAAVYRKAKSEQSVPCSYCGKQTSPGDRHVDHIVPLAKGGSHSADNLCIACVRCNLSKRTKTEEEFRAWRGQSMEQ